MKILVQEARVTSLQAFSMKMVENGQVSFIARYWLRGAFFGAAKVVIYSTLVVDAAICVVLIFCRLTQNIRAKGLIPWRAKLATVYTVPINPKRLS